MATSQSGTPKPGERASSEEPGTNERRQALRRNVVDSFLVTVDLAFQNGALVLDLSETGIGVQALSTAPMGDSTTVQLDLPETGGRVQAVGRIAWTDSSGRLGIRFEEMAELSRVHLGQWLSRERRSLVASSASVGLPAWPPTHARDEIAALRRDLTAENLEGDAALAFIGERVRNITRATGAAIALEDGDAVVCRASSGDAPSIGTRLDPNSGLSGECMRTGEIVRCEDTDTDPRADRLVCRKLELRSIVIVPIRIQGRPAGVVEAFSSRAHAFQSSDVLLLRRVSDLVAAISLRQPEAAESFSAGPHTAMAAASLEPIVSEPSLEQETPIFAEEEFPLMMDEIFELTEEIAAPAASPELAESQPGTPEPQAEVAAQFAAPTEQASEIEAVVALPVDVPELPTVAVQPERFEPAASVQETAAPELEIVTPAADTAAPAIIAPVEAPAVVEEIERPAAEVAPEVQLSAPVEEIDSAAPPEVVAPSPPPAEVVEKVEHPVRPAIPMVEHPAPPVVHKFERPPARVVIAPVERPPRAARMSASTAATAAAAATAPARFRPVPLEREHEELAESRQTAIREALLASTAVQRPSSSAMRIIAGVIVAAVLLIGGWQVWRAVRPAKATPVGAETKQMAAGTPATNPPAPVVTTETTLAVPANAAAKTKSTAAPHAKPASPAPAPKDAATQNKYQAEAETAPAEPMEIGRAEIPEGPPAITSLARPEGPSTISNVLGAPVATPKLDKPPVSEMSGGRLLKRFDPVYPPSSMGLHGEVVLKATIDKDGRVTNVKIVSGHALLGQAAVSAIRRWRYEPFRLNGVPIEVENTIVVNFKAPGQ